MNFPLFIFLINIILYIFFFQNKYQFYNKLFIIKWVQLVQIVDAQLLNMLISEEEHIIAINAEDTALGFGPVEQIIAVFVKDILNDIN